MKTTQIKKTVAGFALSSLLGLSTMGLTGLAMAQDNPAQATPQTQSAAPETGRARHHVDPSEQAQHLARRLKLSADQQSQVVSILTAQRDQAVSMRNDASLSQQDRRAKMQGLHADSQSKIRALLNDDQKAAFDQMQQRRLEKQETIKPTLYGANNEETTYRSSAKRWLGTLHSERTGLCANWTTASPAPGGGDGPAGPRYVWVGGYHRWDGARYVWAPGYWAVPPPHRRAWVPGHWRNTPRGYFWVEGHWR